MKRADRLVEMSVYGMAVEANHQTPIILLADSLQRILLPLWIGNVEASVIMATLEKKTDSRPRTHDLMQAIVHAGQLTILGVDIHRCDESVYYADLRLQNDDAREIRIDCRPSDAIALTLKAGGLIRVAVELLDNAQPFPEKDDHHTVPSLFVRGDDAAGRAHLAEILSELTPEDLGRFRT